MAGNKLDLGKLALKDWIIGVAFVFVGIAIAYGLLGMLFPGAPGALFSAIGAMIGILAFFAYLGKRNA